MLQYRPSLKHAAAAFLAIVVESGMDLDSAESNKMPDAEKLAAQGAVVANHSSEYGRLLRSKGFVWIASRPNFIAEWSQAGVIGHLESAGRWFAATPEDEWPDDEDVKTAILGDFDPEDRNRVLRTGELDVPSIEIGDRRQEIVLIGIGLRKDALTRDLDACLLTADELEAQRAWRARCRVAELGDTGEQSPPNPLADDDPFEEWDGSDDEEDEEEAE